MKLVTATWGAPPPGYTKIETSGYQPDGHYVPNPSFMRMAIHLGSINAQRKGADQHPVGALITAQFKNLHEDSYYERVVSVSHNGTSLTIGHAEIMALIIAEEKIGRSALANWRAVLYTTHEPCPMCAGAIAASKLDGVIYGTTAEDAEALVSEAGIKWRGNAVRAADIINGREEVQGRPTQFIMGQVLQKECHALLAQSPKQQPPA